jgi:hypothetical protein
LEHRRLDVLQHVEVFLFRSHDAGLCRRGPSVRPKALFSLALARASGGSSTDGS